MRKYSLDWWRLRQAWQSWAWQAEYNMSYSDHSKKQKLSTLSF